MVYIYARNVVITLCTASKVNRQADVTPGVDHMALISNPVNEPRHQQKEPAGSDEIV